MVVFGSLLVLPACSQKPETQMLGKWQDGNGTTFEFFKDGTVQTVREGLPEVGTYSFVDQNHLKITYNGGGGAVCVFSVSQNTLNLDNALLTRVGESQGVAPAPAQAAPKPKLLDLNKDTLLAAFQRAGINALPSYLKIADMDFQVVNAVDASRVVNGNLTLEFLDDTFTKSRTLKYQDSSSSYEIQLLKGAKKKGDQITVPYSETINLAAPQMSVTLPTLDDYGNTASNLRHCYIEGGEVATNAEALIDAANDATHKAQPVLNKYKCLLLVKESFADADTFWA
jgi:hypothetical protein